LSSEVKVFSEVEELFEVKLSQLFTFESLVANKRCSVSISVCGVWKLG